MSLSNAEKRARFEKALRCGGNTHDVEDVVALVKEGKAQYWEQGDGIIVSEIHDFPKLKAIHFWVVSGSLRDCLALEHDVLPWAHEQGCSVATACGREGWERVLAPVGWKRWQPNFWKPLVRDTNFGQEA